MAGRGVSPMRCVRCGARLSPGEQACSRCGTVLDSEDTLILRLFESDPGGLGGGERAWLWFLDERGEDIARTHELREAQTIIGREAKCALAIPHSTVSRRHALIRRESAQYLLSDLGSTNGTLLNLEPLLGEEALRDRDEIGIGVFRLIFRQPR